MIGIIVIIIIIIITTINIAIRTAVLVASKSILHTGFVEYIRPRTIHCDAERCSEKQRGVHEAWSTRNKKIPVRRNAVRRNAVRRNNVEYTKQKKTLFGETLFGETTWRTRNRQKCCSEKQRGVHEATNIRGVHAPAAVAADYCSYHFYYAGHARAASGMIMIIIIIINNSTNDNNNIVITTINIATIYEAYTRQQQLADLSQLLI